MWAACTKKTPQSLLTFLESASSLLKLESLANAIITVNNYMFFYEKRDISQIELFDELSIYHSFPFYFPRH